MLVVLQPFPLAKTANRQVSTLLDIAVTAKKSEIVNGVWSSVRFGDYVVHF